MTLTSARKLPAYEYTPDEYSDEPLHWCLPGSNPAERTFVPDEHTSGAIHVVDFEYKEEPDCMFTSRDRFNSVTAARCSRRIRNGRAEVCPFCEDQSRLPRTFSNPDGVLDYEVLSDFKSTVIDSCRSEDEYDCEDIRFVEVAKDSYNNYHMEVVTNTSSLRYAYPQAASLPTWYSLGYAIAQHPWIAVEDVTRFSTDNTRVHLAVKTPDRDEYGKYYYKLISQRDNIPYETRTPDDQNR